MVPSCGRVDAEESKRKDSPRRKTPKKMKEKKKNLEGPQLCSFPLRGGTRQTAECVASTIQRVYAFALASSHCTTCCRSPLLFNRRYLLSALSTNPIARK